MNSLDNNSNYFKSLTGVRAIAAFMVYFHHFNPLNKQSAPALLFNYIQEFHVGVTMFFVLSGFLIAHRYSNMNNFIFKKYIINRIARIYPMYFIFTTATFICFAYLFSQNRVNDLIMYFLNISFLRGFFEYSKFTGIAQGWSLTVEETFYLLAPLFFLLLKKRKIYLILLPIILMSIGVALVSIFSKFYLYSFFYSYDFMFNYTFLGRCTEFFIGIGLALFYRKFHLKITQSYFTYFGIIGIIISIYLISFFKGDYDFGIRHPMGKLINSFLLPVIGIAPFYLGLMKEKTFVSRILGSNIFELLGKSSYVFYLIHMGIFSLLIRHYISNYLLIFVLLNLLAILFYKYLEEPMNLLIRKYFSEEGA